MPAFEWPIRPGPRLSEVARSPGASFMLAPDEVALFVRRFEAVGATYMVTGATGLSAEWQTISVSA